MQTGVKVKRVILGVITSLWPFIALLLFAIIDDSIWNQPSPEPIVKSLAYVAIICAWTGTIPLTLFLWKRILKKRQLRFRVFAAGLLNVAYSAIYYGALYAFFLAVAFGFDHILS